MFFLKIASSLNRMDYVFCRKLGKIILPSRIKGTLGYAAGSALIARDFSLDTVFTRQIFFILHWMNSVRIGSYYSPNAGK